eukprot:3196422-Prymnesium_polylepis.1
MYSGDRHPTRASAPSLPFVSLPRMATPSIIHAVVIRSCSVPQLCAAESGGVHTWVPASGDTHVGPASGCKRRTMHAQSTRRRGARDTHVGPA